MASRATIGAAREALARLVPPGLAPRVARFLAWWRAGLALPLPPAVARLLVGDRRIVRVTAEGERLAVRLYAAPQAAEPLATAAVPEAGGVGLARLRHAAGRAPVVLDVPPTLLLEKRQEIPAAAARAVDDAVRFGLPQWTPFAADEVFWTARVASVRAARAEVVIRLVAKAALQPTVEACGAAGLPPAALRLGPTVVTLDGRRAARRHRGRRLDAALALAVGLLAVVYGGMAWRAGEAERAALTEVLKAEVAVRREAGDLTRRIAALEAADTFLAERRAAARPVSAVVSALAAALPETAEVEALHWAGGRGRLVLVDTAPPVLAPSNGVIAAAGPVRPLSDLADGRRRFEWAFAAAGEGAR